MEIAVHLAYAGVVANFHPGQNLLLLEGNGGLVGDYFEGIEFLILGEGLAFDSQIDEILDGLVVDLSKMFADAFIKVHILFGAEGGLNCVGLPPLQDGFQG